MKRINLSLALLIMFAACEKSEEKPPKEMPLSKDIALSVLSPKTGVFPERQESDKYNFLGFGYDITDRYHDAHSVRSEVVNISALSAGGTYNRINSSTSTTGYWENYSGADAEDLSAKLSNNLDETKEFKVFKNTIINAFPSSDVLDPKYVYGYYANVWIWKRLAVIQDYTSIMSNYLTQAFESDLNSLNAAAVVEKYGTHILVGVELGSKLTAIYQAEAPKTDRSRVSTTGLTYAMQRVFGLPTGQLDPIDLGALNANKDAKISFDAVGGDLNALKVVTVKDREFVNITEWRKTATFENARFLGPKAKGLIPLSNLIKNANKKAEVEAYISKYIQNNEAKLDN